MSEFERWRDSLGVKYPPSEQIIMEWAFKAGYEAGLRRAAGVAHDGLDRASWRAQAIFARDAILAEIKGE